ncbi:MAG TPA: hypothetical protein VM680_12845 [Verrucomicrobiae bacterium]|nr:hypothetical protein [Verrucomicrobiae bacterium]
MIRFRRTPAVLSLIIATLLPAAFGQELRLSSIEIPEEGALVLILADPPSDPVHIEASTNLTSWTPVAIATPDADGQISINDPNPGATAQFFRVFTDGEQSDTFVATVNADYAGPIAGATITVVGPEKTFTTDATGHASIPISDLTFESGFRLKVEAAGFITEIVDLPPALYAYTFSLTQTPLAPAEIVGRTYSLGGSNLITLYDSGLARIESTNGVSIGAYFAERSTTIADNWSIKAAWPDAYESIGLTFSSGTAGRYTNVVNGLTVAGDFAESAFVTASTNPPVVAPAALQTARFVTIRSPVGPGLDFTVTFDGTESGTFTSSGTFDGHGTFTYDGATVNLKWLEEFAGDYDDFTLKFVEGAGLGVKANTFTGTMGAEGLVGEVSGTFSYE